MIERIKALEKLFSLSLIMFLLPFGLLAQNKASITGTVIDKNRQSYVAGITVALKPGNVTTVTDSLGSFRFTGIEPGSYSIDFSGVGYQAKTLTNIVLTTGNITTLNVELDASVSELENVTITSRRNTARAATLESPLSVQKLTTEEIKANPGGNFDISRVIQSLPGVGGGAAGGSFRNDIVIRGGSPSENVFYLDGIEVPVIIHFTTQ
jgi:hypothetical protein